MEIVVSSAVARTARGSRLRRVVGGRLMSTTRPTGKMHASHELDVSVVSPEEAESGIAEFWAGGRLFGFTRLEDGELVLRIEPRSDGGAVVAARTAWPRRWRARSSSSNPRDPRYPDLAG
jgi:hypothetical protein